MLALLSTCYLMMGLKMFIGPAVDESAGVVAAAGARPSPNPKESGEWDLLSALSCSLPSLEL